MTLSLFPYLLSFQLAAPLLLRLTLGIILGHWAYKHFRTNRTCAIIEGIVAILFIIGLYTQLAALVTAIAFIVFMVKKVKAKAFFTDGINYYFILFIIALSLLVTGPGLFAFDMPL